MTHKKKGQLTTSPEWAKHLRNYMKRQFWKGERNAEKVMVRNELQNIGINEIPPNTEVVIKVLSPKRDSETIYKVLNEIIPNRTDINSDYAVHPINENIVFKTEQEMIETFVSLKEEEYSFYYWNEINSENKLSVGVDLTSDGYLIMSIVHIADGKNEYAYLDKLKSILNSEYGTFMYGGLPEFNSGEDFKIKYAPQQ